MRKQKRQGQAVVEFALFATLLFNILSIIIDLGLAFFVYQGIVGAAQEGASYGSVVPDSSAEIRNRVRYEGGIGDQRASFVDLLDLNNDDSVDDASILSQFVLIDAVQNSANAIVGNQVPCGTTTDGFPRSRQFCDIEVTVRYLYEPQFSLAATFGLEQIELQATRQMVIQ